MNRILTTALSTLAAAFLLVFVTASNGKAQSTAEPTADAGFSLSGSVSVGNCQWYATNTAGQLVPSPNCEGAHFDHTVCPANQVMMGFDMCSNNTTMIPIRVQCCTLSVQ